MNAFVRGKHGKKSIYVPTRAGGLVQRACGTKNGTIVRAMKVMVKQFKDDHRWTLLDALTVPVINDGKKTFRLSLARAYDYHTSNRLDELEAELSAKNLADYLDGWIAWCRKNRRGDVATADVYWQQVTTLVKPGETFLATELTKARVKKWLTGRDKATSGTLRKYFYALKSFINYLVDEGVYEDNPLGSMKGPKKNPSRDRWVTAEVDESIVKDANSDYQNFFAFIKGTGCDVSSAIRAQIADVNLFARTTVVRGTKTANRKVIGATIEGWALPYIRRQITKRRTANDGALLFPGITRNPPTKHHAYVCDRLGIVDYSLKDARHSVGVRMRLKGKTFEQIAAQLGTSVYHAVTVYTRHKPEESKASEEAK